MGMARASVVESSLLPQADIEEEETYEVDAELEDLPEELDPAAQEEARIEAEAHRMGWRPLSQFRGEPGTFVTAREFIERGKNFTPFVKKDLERAKVENAKLHNEVRGLRDEMGEIKQIAEQFRDTALQAEQRGYDRAIAELKQRQRNAVVEGNVEAYDEAETEIARAEAERPAAPKRAAPPPPPPPPNGQQADPAVLDFVNANPWFTSDRVLNAAMQEAHVALLESAPGLSTADNLQRAKALVMGRYPAKFGLPVKAAEEEVEEVENQPVRPRRPARPVEPAGDGPAPPAGRQRPELTFASIQDPNERAEARRAFERQKRHMPGFTEAQYMRLYNNPRADGLELVRQSRK